MSTINANAYTATTQAVADAIAASIREGRSATIEASGTAREAIEDELGRESEGSTLRNAAADGQSEFWGVDCDGEEWRVYVTDL